MYIIRYVTLRVTALSQPHCALPPSLPSPPPLPSHTYANSSQSRARPAAPGTFIVPPWWRTRYAYRPTGHAAADGWDALAWAAPCATAPSAARAPTKAADYSSTNRAPKADWSRSGLCTHWPSNKEILGVPKGLKPTNTAVLGSCRFWSAE